MTDTPGGAREVVAQVAWEGYCIRVAHATVGAKVPEWFAAATEEMLAAVRPIIAAEIRRWASEEPIYRHDADAIASRICGGAEK